MATKNLKVRVTVTQQHINKGICTDPNKCAVAKALLDTKLFTRVSIAGEAEGRRSKKNGGGAFIATLPKRAVTFIDRFDDDKTSVKPFSFNLVFKPHPVPFTASV